MRHLSLLITTIALAIAPPALAQVSLTPTIGATSPLGMTPGSSVAPTGIPMGATQLASPGLSPLPCSTAGAPSTATSGSTTTFDGGGLGMGTGTSMPGSTAMSAPCGGTAGSSASSIAATSPMTPGGAARAGIPLGSFEIGSAGVSPPPLATSVTTSLPVTTAMPSTPFVITPSTTPATFDASSATSSSAGMASSSTLPNGLPTACAGVPGNINSTSVFRSPC
jgi:hypothetical protein